MKRVYFLAIVLVVFAYLPVYATIINIPDDYATIQEGIDASSDGDTVRVAPGTYVENIDFAGKNIVVGSWFLDDGDPSYISSTIIDGNHAGSVVSLLNGADNTAVITGFTIQNGFAQYGGGIYCHSSDPTISDNTITGNFAEEFGGGIYCGGSNATISNNVISGNTAGWGGGIDCFYHCSPTITSNTISGNSAAYDGGGIDCNEDANPTISDNTITGNFADDFGGGIRCAYSSPVITNTIFWGDSAPTGPEIHLEGTSSPVITYCDVQGGWEGEGNIDCDPMFCYPDTGNYYLHANSCCVGAGEGGVDIGAFGVGCGIEIPTLSEWGMVIMALLLLAVGTVAVIRRRRAATAGAA